MSDNQPTKKFRTGVALGVQLSCWVDSNGNSSFQIRKTYKDKETNEWKQTSSLYPSDLAALAILAPQAIAYADEQKVKASNANGRNSAPRDDGPPPDDSGDIPF